MIPRLTIHPGPGGQAGAKLTHCSDGQYKAMRKAVHPSHRRRWEGGGYWIEQEHCRAAGDAVLKTASHYEVHHPDGSVETVSKGGTSVQASFI